MDRSKNSHFRVADRPADYKKLEIAPVRIAEFEDGQRIGTEKGRYEWWYFDAHLDDGATVVVVFYTKPNVSPNSPLAPRITINITLPDGRAFEKLHDTRPELFNASKSSCDVRIGTSRFVGDLHRYHAGGFFGLVRPWLDRRRERLAGHCHVGDFYLSTARSGHRPQTGKSMPWRAPAWYWTPPKSAILGQRDNAPR